MYELWDKARSGKWIDLGLVFLENAFRVLKENGRLGIVLSNSLASIDRWEEARKWLIEKNYNVFVKDIHKVGYEIRTSKRVKFFSPIYKIDQQTFEVEQDRGGNP